MKHKSFYQTTLSILAILGTLLFSLPATALIRANPASPSDLDTTFAGFGNGGKATTFSFKNQHMALQPDGKIVMVGYR